MRSKPLSGLVNWKFSFDSPRMRSVPSRSFSVSIWFSISVGAAPGCEIDTLTAGNSMSGLLTTSIRAKLIRPASSSAVKATSGMTGLRIDQAEMLRKFIELPLLNRLRPFAS